MSEPLDYTKFAEIVELYNKLSTEEKYTLLKILSVINYSTKEFLSMDNIDSSYDKDFINSLPDSIKSKYYEIEALCNLDMCCSNIRCKVSDFVKNNEGTYLNNTGSFFLLEKLQNVVADCDFKVFDCQLKDCNVSDGSFSFSVVSNKTNDHKSFTLFFAGDSLVFQQNFM